MQPHKSLGVAAHAVTIALAFAVAGILPAAEGTTAAQSPSRVDVSTRAIVRAVSRYVADYQREFALLVADEEYTQTLRTTAGRVIERSMRGELFLTYLETEGEWTAVRDVSEVDGRPVEGREDLRALLRAGAMSSIARRVVDRNARFNLGSVTRNFNEPMVALLMASARRTPNVRFDVQDVNRTGPGTPVVTLGFRERDRPTLVRGVRGQPIYARGSMVVEAATGRVRRTHISFSDPPVLAEMETFYALDHRLGLWVPSEWLERYTLAIGRDAEVVSGRSVYSNYRRFEVSGRIK